MRFLAKTVFIYLLAFAGLGGCGVASSRQISVDDIPLSVLFNGVNLPLSEAKIINNDLFMPPLPNGLSELTQRLVISNSVVALGPDQMATMLINIKTFYNQPNLLVSAGNVGGRVRIIIADKGNPEIIVAWVEAYEISGVLFVVSARNRP